MAKRIFTLFLLTALLLLSFPTVQADAVAKPQDSTSDIRVMSANVRAEFASWSSDGVAPESTSTRVLRLATMLEENNPMVVATQEMSPTWYTAFAKLDSEKWAWLEESDVAGYSYYNFVPNKGLALNSILYRKDLLTLYTHGVEAYTTRNNGQCIVWGVFTINATGKQVVIISTHWTPGSDKADTRLAQAEQLANKVNSLRNVYGDTVIVMGDFNCNDQTQEFRRFLINSNSVDSRPGADSRGDSLNKIDHITATGDASFTYHTICYEANGKYAISDHPFAVADVKLSSSLMFDFTDNADSRAHYKQGAYRHNAYDYHAAYWRYDTALVSNRTINKTDGTLTLNLTSKGNPYVVASTTDTLDPKSAYGLNFDPSGSQYASIRFRLNGCELVDSSVSPSVTIGAPQSGAWVGDKATYTLSKATSGYLSLTIKLTKNGLLSLSKMGSLYLSFDNIKNGTVTIDYIYVGQRLSKPISYALFFDYSNTSADQSRYSGTSYGGHNFDTGYWTTAGYGSTKDYSFNTSEDTISIKVKNTNELGPVLATAPTAGSYQWNANGACLSYSPAQAEVMQIRFKLSNCQTVSGKNSRILLMYGGMYNGVFDGDNYENLANYTVKNGEFIIVTMPLSDLLRQAEKITQVGIRFQYIEGMTAGTATIDYLYIGPENGLPTKHVYNHKVTAATCTAQGYTTHTCATCGYSYKDTYTAITKHTYTSKVTTAATCTKAGVKTFTCSKCSHSYTEAITATGHTEVVDKAVAATCTTAGKTEGSHCSVCNAVIKAQTTVAATGHSYTYKATKNPTTSATGTLTGTCSKCSGTTTVTLPKLNTTDYTKTVTKAATCTETGTDTYKWKTTTYGSFSFTATTTATGHSYTYKATKKPTTSATGTLTGTCSKCSGTTTVSLPKLNTTDYTKTVTKAPTCTATGTDTYKWKTTTYGTFSFTATTAALGHSYTAKVTAPTCTAQGYTTHTCSRCSDSYKDTYTNATGHSYTSKVTTAATCTKAGVKTYTCSKCSDSYTEAIAATGHTEVIDKAVAATCTTDGKTEGSHCSVCNAVIKAQTTVPATGHSYSYKSNGDGTHTATCARCNDSYTENHSFGNGTCACGDAEITLDEGIKILHTLDLASDISVTFAVQKTALANYDSYYLECVLPEYNGNELIGTSTMQVQSVVSGNYYYFTLTGITAVRMGDMVEAVLHMTKGTQEYISKTDSYSVATYAYGMLNSSKDAKMLTLCADLLRYGAEAQAFKGYRTDALVDADMTEIHRSYLSDTETLSFTATDSYLGDLANPTITWVGKTLDLGSKVGMKFVFNTKNYSGDLSKLSMKVTYQGSTGETKSVTVTGIETYNAANKQYSFTFYGLLASELRTIVDVAIYNGNTQLSETLRYSAESYAAKTGTTALAALTKALFAYSDSAKAFFAK